jgi:hypothetical protein
MLTLKVSAFACCIQIEARAIIAKAIAKNTIFSEVFEL